MKSYLELISANLFSYSLYIIIDYLCFEIFIKKFSQIDSTCKGTKVCLNFVICCFPESSSSYLLCYYLLVGSSHIQIKWIIKSESYLATLTILTRYRPYRCISHHIIYNLLVYYSFLCLVLDHSISKH
jgi:hypothetical protein